MGDLFSSAEIYDSDDPERIVCVEAEYVDAGWEVLTQPGAGGGLQWIPVCGFKMDEKRVTLVLDEKEGQRATVLPRGWKVTARPA